MGSIGWMNLSSTDPRQIAQQNRQYAAATGQGLMDQAGADATTNGQRADQTNQQIQGLLDPSGTMSRLNDWMSPLASGNGGYNSSELSQIQMTPQQQQDMVTQAGVSAGLSNAASTGAAERASAAAGGNPAALATYRARAAQSAGKNAGDAMTGARVAASDAAATRAENIGNTRIGQQNTGLNYYSGLQGQGTSYLTGLQGQQAGAQQSALNRQTQNYGTTVGAMNGAAGTAQQASQNPTTFDKVMGGIGGALGALEDGAVMPQQKQSAVIAENGPEKVVSTRSQYMDAGGVIPSLYRAGTPPIASSLGTGAFTGSSAAPPAPVAYKAPDLGTTTPNADGSLTFTPGADNPGLVAQKPGGFKGFLNQMKTAAMGQAPMQAQQQPQQPSAMNSARTIGQGVGTLARFLEDGDMIPQEKQGVNGLFTQPTRVNLLPGEAVVPLSYRATAKVRPSTAALPAANVTIRGGAGRGYIARP